MRHWKAANAERFRLDGQMASAMAARIRRYSVYEPAAGSLLYRLDEHL